MKYLQAVADSSNSSRLWAQHPNNRTPTSNKSRGSSRHSDRPVSSRQSSRPVRDHRKSDRISRGYSDRPTRKSRQSDRIFRGRYEEDSPIRASNKISGRQTEKKQITAVRVTPTRVGRHVTRSPARRRRDYD